MRVVRLVLLVLMWLAIGAAVGAVAADRGWPDDGVGGLLGVLLAVAVFFVLVLVLITVTGPVLGFRTRYMRLGFGPLLVDRVGPRRTELRLVPFSYWFSGWTEERTAARRVAWILILELWVAVGIVLLGHRLMEPSHPFSTLVLAVALVATAGVDSWRRMDAIRDLPGMWDGFMTARSSLITNLDEVGRTADADRLLEEALATDPDPVCLKLAADRACLAGDDAAYRAYAERLAAAGMDLAYLANDRLAFLTLRAEGGQPGEAWLTEAPALAALIAERAARRPDYGETLAAFLVLRGRVDEAAATLDRTAGRLHRIPPVGRAHVAATRALIEGSRGRFSRARRELARARKLAPGERRWQVTERRIAAMENGAPG